MENVLTCAGTSLSRPLWMLNVQFVPGDQLRWARGRSPLWVTLVFPSCTKTEHLGWYVFPTHASEWSLVRQYSPNESAWHEGVEWVRKGLSVLESGNREKWGVLLELIDSRCVFQINWRSGLCLYCEPSSVMALRVYWNSERVSEPPHKPITELYTFTR